MAKDYAKKYAAPRKSSHTGKSKKTSFGRLWLLALTLIILFGAGLYFLKHEKDRLSDQQQPPQAVEHVANMKKLKVKPHSEATPKSTRQDTSANQPRFDFYTVLPANHAGTKNNQSSVASNEDQQKQDISNQTLDDPGKITTPGYILQVGVFSNFADADQLKAKLVLEGFDVNLSSLKNKDQIIYRVWMGVFKTYADAKKQQSALKASQVSGEIIKLPIK